MNTHRFLLAALGSVVLAISLAFAATPPTVQKPNVLFIAIDDQNDWIGHLGGHPMA